MVAMDAFIEGFHIVFHWQLPEGLYRDHPPSLHSRELPVHRNIPEIASCLVNPATAASTLVSSR